MIDIIAPATAPQILAQAAANVQHPLAPEVLSSIRQSGMPVGLWKLINSLADLHQAISRTQKRCLRLRFLGAVRELLHARLLCRHIQFVAASEFATRPKPRSRDRRSSHDWKNELHVLPTVSTSPCEMPVSNPVVAVAEPASNLAQTSETKVDAGKLKMPTCITEATSATPTVAQISAAASALARRPRKVKRPWTGCLDGERVKRGTLIQVPTGEVLLVYLVLRGKVFVTLPDEPRYADRVFERYDASQVRRAKMPERSFSVRSRLA